MFNLPWNFLGSGYFQTNLREVACFHDMQGVNLWELLTGIWRHVSIAQILAKRHWRGFHYP